jgi:hypothetical protein
MAVATDNVGRFRVWGPYTASTLGDMANRTLVCDWLAQHDIDAKDVRAVGVFRNADDTARHLHATLMARDADGRIRTDLASEQVVTEPHVVPLLAPPPVLDETAHVAPPRSGLYSVQLQRPDDAAPAVS